MKPEEIKLSDWGRIFAGQVAPEFYLELLLRAAFVYLLLMVSMRLMGKRMSVQMSRLEIAAMVSLAAAIGVPMLSPERGLLPAVVIAAVVVLVTRALSVLSNRNQKFEKITQDHLDVLIKDGVLNTKLMEKVRISREQVLSQLRSEALLHLGQVQRLYMEANGSFSLLRSKHSQPGLPVLPEWDTDFVAEMLELTSQLMCNHCGTPAPISGAAGACPNCGSEQWVNSVQEKN